MILAALIPAPYRLLAGVVAIAIAAALLVGSGYRWGYGDADDKRVAEVATLAATHATERAAQERAAREAVEAHRAKEQQWARERAEGEAKHAAEVKALQSRIADIARATAGLRDDIRAAAAECGAAADDPVAACRAYAAALGELLTEFRTAGLQAAEAAELHAADVRRLLTAWPQ